MPTIQNANDVQLYLETTDSGTKRGTAPSLGRMVVDDFSITDEEDNSLEGGVGRREAAGHTLGNKTGSFEFTIKGEDLTLFTSIVRNTDGESIEFTFEARGLNTSVKAVGCRYNSIEHSGSDGDVTEYAVSGTCVRVDFENSGR